MLKHNGKTQFTTNIDHAVQNMIKYYTHICNFFCHVFDKGMKCIVSLPISIL